MTSKLQFIGHMFDTGKIHFVLLSGAVLWVTGIVAAPLLEWEWIYAVFSRVCHQGIERSFQIASAPFAVCIRCTAIYLGFFLALGFRFEGSRLLLLSGIALTAFDLLFAFFFMDLVTTRFWSGLVLGVGVGGFFEKGIRDLLER